MTLSIAIIYTGELRTIEKTMYYFKKNILEINPSIHLHVFAILQNCEEMDSWIRENMGEHLKSLEWLDKFDTTWKTIQKRLLSNMNISQNWKDYLENSGSMIEYYQLYLAYSNMVKYEYNTNIRYDFVLRIRPDIVINKPLDFSVFRKDSYYYTKLFDSIQLDSEEDMYNTEMRKKQLYFFMNSLLDHGRHQHMTNMHSNNIMEKLYNENKELDHLIQHFTPLHIHNAHSVSSSTLKNCPQVDVLNAQRCNYEFLERYIHQGNYVISLRKNIVYIAGREKFGNIAMLGMMYGLQKIEENQFWFDAESQFEVTCIQGGYTVFNTTSLLEDKSLYDYNQNNYFKEDGVVKTDSSFLFFICRQ